MLPKLFILFCAYCFFQLKLNSFKDSLTAAYMGYDETTLPLKKQARQHLVFELNPSASMLAEAVIVASKESLEDYLIRKILENKDKNDKKHLQN